MFTAIVSLLVVLVVTGSASTCTDKSPLSYIETALANLSTKCSKLSYSSCESSLTGVTSLLQLSLLKELLGEYKTSPNDKGEGLAILNRMELLLNNTVDRLDAMESKLEKLTVEKEDIRSLEARLLSSIKRNTQLIQAHDNITQETLDQLDDKLPNLPRSCEEVLKKWPNISSGYYRLVDAYGHARQVYCHMESLCNSEGGWMRVSHLDMRNSNEKCPKGLRLYQVNGVRACGRPTSSGGSCAGITFPMEFKYSQVCGKVIGYQKGYPDGTYSTSDVDGVVLTHGSSRNHLWSFIASPFEVVVTWGYFNKDYVYCPCSPTGKSAPSYVGNHYFCESGDRDTDDSYDVTRLYTGDRLWDGKQCSVLEHYCCCQGPPWFHRSLSHTTTDYIEMRLCFDQGTGDEDSPVEQYEIYVK